MLATLKRADPLSSWGSIPKSTPWLEFSLACVLVEYPLLCNTMLWSLGLLCAQNHMYVNTCILLGNMHVICAYTSTDM